MNSVAATNSSPGYVGRIPIRNLWLLMLYASDLFRMRGTNRVGIEEMPDDLPDLIAEILAHAVEERKRRNLNRAYRSRHAVLDRVRGRIDLLATERKQLLMRGKVACRFEELTIDTPRNRYVRGALDSIARIAQDHDLAHRCRKLAHDLRCLGVTGIVPTPTQMSADRFGRHDANDRFMVAAARLAFDLTLLTEDAGNASLPLPGRREEWARKLFERAVGGFYAVTLTPKQWRVSTGTRLRWPIEAKTARIGEILPTMKTDIVLEHSPSDRKIVIDTKFTSILSEGWYRSETLDRDDMFQIYAYLRSQTHRDTGGRRSEGMLLHPSVGEDIDEAVRIQGHTIRFATVNLAGEPTKLRDGLLRLVDQPMLD